MISNFKIKEKGNPNITLYLGLFFSILIIGINYFVWSKFLFSGFVIFMYGLAVLLLVSSINQYLERFVEVELNEENIFFRRNNKKKVSFKINDLRYINVINYCALNNEEQKLENQYKIMFLFKDDRTIFLNGEYFFMNMPILIRKLLQKENVQIQVAPIFYKEKSEVINFFEQSKLGIHKIPFKDAFLNVSGCELPVTQKDVGDLMKKVIKLENDEMKRSGGLLNNLQMIVSSIVDGLFKNFLWKLGIIVGLSTILIFIAFVFSFLF